MGRPLLLLALLLLPTAAGGADLALGGRVGTLGPGLELAAPLGERTRLRLAASVRSHDDSLTVDGLAYDADLDLAAALLLLDWHPAGGAFRVSLGGGWNGSEAVVSTPLEDLLRRERPDLPPLGVDLGTAVGTARGRRLAPALLLGWGNAFRGGRWSVGFEVGAHYQGRPEVELEARTSIPVASIPGGEALLAALLEEEERAIEEELEEVTVLPIVALTVGRRF